MSRLVFCAAIIAVTAAGSASAQTRWAPGSNNTIGRTPADVQQTYLYSLKMLRKEIVRQQAAEGGRLTPASLARFQKRLDDINDARVRRLRNAEVWTVDASGRPVAG